ncbi:BsuPI-related putative proteinase inhibitor [Lentibacillus sediminis]|uniref:BsuPI-related putative proteinase inhibitor n=1 Tax=Lentibacillus sediminis TaxID=1940529 RepID=UPI000C1B998F|nr:BsuPI-related putative proteinase inhibitor [Lentibacillus sediminis]
MIKPKSLIPAVFLLSFSFILAACANETSTDNGDDHSGREAAEISEDRIIYALNPVKLSQENTVYEFTITNESDREKELSFTTSQRYEYELRNKENELIQRFSDGKAFMQVLGNEELAPGDQLSYELKLPPLEIGEYTLTAYSVARGLSGNQVRVEFVIEDE